MKKTLNILLLIITVLVLEMTVLPQNTVFCTSSVPESDGKYKIPIEKDMKMGKQYFSDDIILEKEGENYYLTFGLLDFTALPFVKIDNGYGDIVGTTEKEEGISRYYTYTLTKEAVSKPIGFKTFVKEMGMEVNFNITIKYENAIKLGDKIDDKGERPAYFVPSLTTIASDNEVEKGTVYKVEPAKAVLSGNEIPVSIKVYYERNGEKTDIEIKDNKIKFDNVGTYHIVYRAESDLFKTNLGNNTFAEKEIILNSKIGAQSYGKVELKENSSALPKGFACQANLIREGNEVYTFAENKMKGYADNFEVVNLTLYDKDGEIINPTGKVDVYLKANNFFDRNKIEVFYISENGELEKIEASGYGRYVKCDTDKVGDFIICVEGTEFHMPMWAYAVITVSVILIAVAAVAVTVILIKKKKAKAN